MSVKPNTNDPLRRAKIELVCLGRTLMPDKDSLERTLGTLVLMGVWAITVISPILFPWADPLPYEFTVTFTGFVFVIVGRMWRLEVESIDLPGVSIETKDREDED